MPALADLLPMVALLVVIGGFAGVVAGLLGVGGGIVLVPAFYYAFTHLGYGGGQLMQICVATSLATIVVTSPRSVMSHHKKGAVDWQLLREWAPFIVIGALAGTLVASPDPIAGNTTVQVRVCLNDATGQGVSNVRLQFTFQDLFGNGTVDGTAGSGSLANLTGSDGCVNATVVTSGVPNSDSTDSAPPKVIFSLGALKDDVTIRVNNNYYLYAFPSRTYGDGARLFTLRLVDSSGTRVPGVLIVGSCDATSPQFLNISTHPGNTNAQGETTTIVDADGFDIVGGAGGGGGDAGCTFRTINNEASVEIVWGTRDICDLFSPTPPAGCPIATLTVTLGTAGSVMSTNPTGALQCVGAGSCIGTFHPLDTVTMTASGNATWGLACASCPAGTQTCSVALGGDGSNTTCSVTIP